MASRSSLLSVVTVAAVVACMLHLVLSPTFVGMGSVVPSRQSHTATRVSDITEIMVTCPSVGARTRMVVQPDTTIDTIVTRARTSLGFDQSFLKDTDFKVYKKEDEDKVLTGKIGDHGLVPWGPEGMELHIYYDPPQ